MEKERKAGVHSAQHTPGPWRAVGATVEDCTGEDVALTDMRERDECIANARLIAAAPALLDALERLLAQYAPYAQQTVDLESEAALLPSVRRARTAIAQARGEA